MQAMQYAVPLPTDYDMGIIRERVARTGHLMDGFPGLEFKAFVIRERATGAAGNEYAPFYVWRETEGMRAFCWGEPGYSAIVRDFGRRPIQGWTVDRIARGARGYADARSLRIETLALPETAPPSQQVATLGDGFLGDIGGDTIAKVAAVDVSSWTMILVELSAAAPAREDTGAVVYEVLHVAAAR